MLHALPHMHAETMYCCNLLLLYLALPCSAWYCLFAKAGGGITRDQCYISVLCTCPSLQLCVGCIGGQEGEEASRHRQLFAPRSLLCCFWLQRPLCNGCGIPIWSGAHEW